MARLRVPESYKAVVAKSIIRAMSSARSLSLPSQATTSPQGVSSSNWPSRT